MKMDMKDIGLESTDWVHLTDNRGQRWAVVSTIRNVQIPKNDTFDWSRVVKTLRNSNQIPPR
jgi:hypothetical protein